MKFFYVLVCSETRSMIEILDNPSGIFSYGFTPSLETASKFYIDDLGLQKISCFLTYYYEHEDTELVLMPKLTRLSE